MQRNFILTFFITSLLLGKKYEQEVYAYYDKPCKNEKLAGKYSNKDKNQSDDTHCYIHNASVIFCFHIHCHRSCWFCECNFFLQFLHCLVRCYNICLLLIKNMEQLFTSKNTEFFFCLENLVTQFFNFRQIHTNVLVLFLYDV